MSTILIPANILRETKRLFGRLRHQRMTLPVLHHILLQADHQGVRLTATNLDHWIETRVSEDPHEPAEFLISADAMEAACRGDRGSPVAFTSFGGKRSKDLGLVVIQGGIEATSVHPTLDPKEFPERPEVKGEETTLTPDTIRNLAVVAGCASNDRTRQVLNGVYFTTEHGGQLVATNGRLLAVSPAAVPPQEFILPNLAAQVLDHPNFHSDLVTFTWVDAKDPEVKRVAFRCGRHLLVATALTGTYPNYRQVVPAQAKELAVIPHDRRSGLIAWLRSLKSGNHHDPSVRLDWNKCGHLTLTHRDDEGRSAILHVPVEIHGKPQVIAFHPIYLAQALEIGATLCLSDEVSPGLFRHPNGRFCVLMPMRVTIPAAANTPETATPTKAAQAAGQGSACRHESMNRFKAARITRGDS